MTEIKRYKSAIRIRIRTSGYCIGFQSGKGINVCRCNRDFNHAQSTMYTSSSSHEGLNIGYNTSWEDAFGLGG